MEPTNILITTRGSLRVITFNNPRKKNALNHQTYKEFTAALIEAANDDRITVVALTGTGDFYSSGNDISLITSNSDESMDDRSNVVLDFIHAFVNFPKLLVAVVNGPAVGIAATTLALCDIVYASETAYFYTPFTKIGLCSEAGSSYTFPKILGKSKANEMLLLSHRMTAKEALQFNFISEIFTQRELVTKIWPKIESFSELSNESVKVCKKLNQIVDRDILLKAIEMEMEELNKRFTSEDFFNSLMKFHSAKSKM